MCKERMLTPASAGSSYQLRNDLYQLFAGRLAMTLRKIRETAGSMRPVRSTVYQPPYHSEIDPDYLTALQAAVDEAKPKDFKLTPIGDPGW